MLSAVAAAGESASDQELNSSIIKAAEELMRKMVLARICFIQRQSDGTPRTGRQGAIFCYRITIWRHETLLILEDRMKQR